MTRNEKGQFAKGQTGNPKGRPPKERETRYYEIMVTAVTPQDWHEIVLKAVTQAKKGDPTARKWLTDYIVGTPEQNVNISGGMTLIWDLGKSE